MKESGRNSFRKVLIALALANVVTIAFAAVTAWRAVDSVRKFENVNRAAREMVIDPAAERSEGER